LIYHKTRVIIVFLACYRAMVLTDFKLFPGTLLCPTGTAEPELESMFILDKSALKEVRDKEYAV